MLRLAIHAQVTYAKLLHKPELYLNRINSINAFGTRTALAYTNEDVLEHNLRIVERVCESQVRKLSLNFNFG